MILRAHRKGQSPISFLSILLNLVLSLSLVSNSHASSDNATEALRQTLLWGPYRPNVYFGIRPRLPQSLLMGIMWARLDDYAGVQQLFRHTCEQHQLDGYGWTSYDPRTGGIQEFHDPANGIDLTTSFVKLEASSSAQSWAVRIKGTTREDIPKDSKTTLIFNLGFEGALGHIQVDNEAAGSERGFEGPIKLSGDMPELGPWRMELRESEDSKHPEVEHEASEDKDLSKTLVRSAMVRRDLVWQSLAVLFGSIKATLDDYFKRFGQENAPPPCQVYTIENKVEPGNYILVQKVFEGSFEVDLVFTSDAATLPSSSDLESSISSMTTDFSKRFSSIFKPKSPFTKNTYTEFGKSLLSNLLGGIGYFYGDSRVDRSYDDAYEENGDDFWIDAKAAQERNEPEADKPQELFTSVPSRPFFPRGFLWDEGFHLMPILDWDADLALEIVQSWFRLMDDDGWIGREQILGPEARSKVPPEFQVQYPHYANPPTLYMVIDSYVSKLSKDTPSTEASGVHTQHMLTNREAATEYLRNLYPLLRKHYDWFRRSQSGDLRSFPHNPASDDAETNNKEAYRWRGRTPTHVLTSGLDDYPRPQPPSPGELHVDALAWVGVMVRTLERVADFLGEKTDLEEYRERTAAVRENLSGFHWDEKAGTWCDLGWIEETETGEKEEDGTPIKVTVEEGEESQRVCHKGYLSILPWLVGMVDPASKVGEKEIGRTLDLIADSEELWTDFGLRSLSKRDELYGTAENYWRGPVWINMNYLAVERLFELAQSSSKHAARATKLYNALRKNLVQTVHAAWEKSGFAYEQYHPDTGAGQRTEHFTGWTSLVVKIQALPELVESSKGGRVRDEL